MSIAPNLQAPGPVRVAWGAVQQAIVEARTTRRPVTIDGAWLARLLTDGIRQEATDLLDVMSAYGRARRIPYGYEVLPA